MWFHSEPKFRLIFEYSAFSFFPQKENCFHQFVLFVCAVALKPFSFYSAKVLPSAENRKTATFCVILVVYIEPHSETDLFCRKLAVQILFVFIKNIICNWAKIQKEKRFVPTAMARFRCQSKTAQHILKNWRKNRNTTAQKKLYHYNSFCFKSLKQAPSLIGRTMCQHGNSIFLYIFFRTFVCMYLPTYTYHSFKISKQTKGIFICFVIHFPPSLNTILPRGSGKKMREKAGRPGMMRTGRKGGPRGEAVGTTRTRWLKKQKKNRKGEKKSGYCFYLKGSRISFFEIRFTFNFHNFWRSCWVKYTCTARTRGTYEFHFSRWFDFGHFQRQLQRKGKAVRRRNHFLLLFKYGRVLFFCTSRLNPQWDNLNANLTKWNANGDVNWNETLKIVFIAAAIESPGAKFTGCGIGARKFI